MGVDSNDEIYKKNDQRVCWKGQAGGLEGLRQKGWSVLNMLVIEREAKIRNTQIKLLAQEDNQVICTQYKLKSHRDIDELQNHIDDVLKNNEIIMERIRVGTRKIGLLINDDETLQSSDMLIYSKNILFRGNMTCLEEKKLSRVMCITNDQFPTMANTLSTVSTNCLTMAHFSPDPFNAIISYNWLGNFVRNMVDDYNPALRAGIRSIIKGQNNGDADSMQYKVASLYLDPSLGGVCGMALTRF